MSNIKTLMPIDADMLRDLTSSDFEAANHNHDTEYYSMDPSAVVGQQAIYVNNEISSKISYNNFWYYRSWTSAGTINFSVPVGTKALYIICIGGGGGGGSATTTRWAHTYGSGTFYGNSAYIAAAGSGGCTGIRYYSGSIPSTIYITVGIAGIGSASATSYNGTDGGSSYVSLNNTKASSICIGEGGYAGAGGVLSGSQTYPIRILNPQLYNSEFYYQNTVNDITMYHNVVKKSYACQFPNPFTYTTGTGPNICTFIKFPSGGDTFLGTGAICRSYDDSNKIINGESSRVFYPSRKSFEVSRVNQNTLISPTLGGGGFGGWSYVSYNNTTSHTGYGSDGAPGAVFLWGYK